jgi:ATP-dependent DNA helicase RecG
METQFSARNDEKEMQAGLFRVGVPRVDQQAFREALANAFVHRDYARLGAVHVKLDDRELMISNPGGFVEGLTPANILQSPPRPRNPALADAFKRVGLVERTGRGVDRIYREVVRFGRPRPSYAQSDATMVVLRIPAADADLALLRRIIETENRGVALPTMSLIALSVLRELRRVAVDEMADLLNVEHPDAKAVLEGLMEAGLVDAHGRTRSRTYTLAKRIYAEEGDATAYERQVGPSVETQADMVLAFAREHGQAKRADVMDLCKLSGDQATRLLNRLVEAGRLVREGRKRGARYRLPEAP